MNKVGTDGGMVFEIVITGRVQGVGYRHFVRQQAHLLGIKGRVKNLYDGRVKVIAQGENLLAFLEKLREGPVFAQVEDLLRTELPDSGDYEDFRII